MIKVLIVDDSAIVRKVLSEALSRFNDIEVIGTAVDPYNARDKIVKLRPDVITLDLEMPRMDGLSFLAKIMKHLPMPVVIVSSVAPQNSANAIKALELGAVDVICKPGSEFSAHNISRNLVSSIRAAASAKLTFQAGKITVQQESIISSNGLLVDTTNKIIAIGASTGGTKAIETVLTGLPRTSPGTLIVQHMPEKFTTSFANRLNDICEMEVREAMDNDRVIPGVALIAPGNHHMILKRSGGNYLVNIKGGPRVHYQRPSVDVLFNSVAKNAGPNAVGALLTGMGADGAAGLLAMKKTGAKTIAQDEATSVVFGMPKEAIKLNAVDHIVPVYNIAQKIFNLLKGSPI